LIAFLGYVLPFGQMSIWGATVITNLISAIPYIGNDLVVFIWGGFNEEPLNSDIHFQNLLIAGISSNKFRYNINLFVKRLISRRKSAEIENKLPAPATGAGAYLKVSQRLNAGDLTYAMLVGLIEGDGWFSISKKGKYLIYELGIELNIRDVQLIYKIKKLLGVGIISFKKDTVLLIIRNKDHLINIILPIFNKYPMLTNKQYDFLRFKDNLLSNIILYDDLPKNYIRPNLPKFDANFILNQSYFSAWLIGFIEAEGCFSIYKPLKDTSLVASFDIAQKNGSEALKAISIYLSFTQKINLENNSYKIKVSSVRSIENLIKFMDKAPVKLLGYKKLQYILWLKQLRTIQRYNSKFIIPNTY